MNEVTRLEYVNACLKAEGVEERPEAQIALLARIRQEWSERSGAGPMDNALDLTEGETGATAYNAFGPGRSLHVWNYESLAEGAQAFHDILVAEEYSGVRALLVDPKGTADEIVAAWNKTRWGYMNPELVGEVRGDFAKESKLLVPSVDPMPAPAPVDEPPAHETPAEAAKEAAVLPLLGPGKHTTTTAVKLLQRQLNAAEVPGASLKLDGDFGAKTEAKVKAFQKKAGLTVDGIVGPKTWVDLLEV